jgi:hypothetical protein
MNADVPQIDTDIQVKNPPDIVLKEEAVRRLRGLTRIKRTAIRENPHSTADSFLTADERRCSADRHRYAVEKSAFIRLIRVHPRTLL